MAIIDFPFSNPAVLSSFVCLCLYISYSSFPFSLCVNPSPFLAALEVNCGARGAALWAAALHGAHGQHWQQSACRCVGTACPRKKFCHQQQSEPWPGIKWRFQWRLNGLNGVCWRSEQRLASSAPALPTGCRTAALPGVSQASAFKVPG